ncbi:MULTISPECIES: hypothetical protein [unclassified Haladaptatus]|uniref:hypothetical protein n=1 Tax=unclassified Haladaptatus TaxID=2622732 RepID=UPI00209C3296|nr:MULTISPECIES: hypothetical protein [unclassified Haladaptatus]MCO8245897.1 hypothetical protein [Haladaptatus sp. AB643]MCO8254483.1 hypothetical protein [Haladaptatus sp. AB618]
MAGETEFEPDEERMKTLRDIADDIRGESSESRLVAAMLYRVSDLFDPNEETTPRDIFLNMRTIIRTKDAGGKGK